MEVRLIQPGDYGQVLNIENNIWNASNTPAVLSEMSLEELEESLKNRGKAVAVEETEVLGFIDFSPFFKGPAGSLNWYIGIGVKPEAERRGAGTELLSWLKQHAKNEGIRKISLRVLSTNRQAIPFYERNGFEKESHFRREFYIDGKFVDDLQYGFLID